MTNKVPSRAFVCIGFMGAGKTTAARSIATALNRPATDIDQEIERRLGKPIAQIFAQDGEPAFRHAEEEVTLELLDDPRTAAVSLGGGAVASQAIRQALAHHPVIWLDVDLDTAWARAQGSGRPLARDRATFEALHAEREPLYASLADAIVPAARSATMAPVLDALRGMPAGARMVWASSASGDYPVYIGAGILLERRFWPPSVDGRRFLVTDGRVGQLYGDVIEPVAGRVTVMPGEQSKTVAHAEIVWTELLRAGVNRDDLVVALGGGVVGDLAGFCAATYQRGVRYVQVPTTLVAQVDSAYGGKTGVDLEEAKNYVGAYHQPVAVIADTSTLATLPAEEVAAGYAEVVKTALIAGGDLWERVRSGAEPTDPEVIMACARAKLAVVALDERDEGLRQVLNLGHTVAHAIETATGYARYRHGEAVALGLLAALRLSERDDLRHEVESLLAAHGLPTMLTGADPDDVVRATARDKKRRGEGPVPFVLVDAPGAVRPGCPVDGDALAAAVRELGEP
ncbi:MAG: shikimate kinase / 3-dehydroquinate synthase [Solirubrobacteraceae bacterium]|jgi:shikimate kinase/3-dehydroquinate synthase|nr:shikimate kinase / 3-dehydroquinate synthase [Solirubrobacteraceae bacterium]